MQLFVENERYGTKKLNPNLRYVAAAILAVFLLVGVPACMCSKRINVDSGHEVVLVMKPVFFGHGGTVKETVKEGSIWCFSSTEGYQYPMMPFQEDEKFDNMNTIKKSLVDFDSFVKIQILQPAVLHQKFGVNWYKANVEQYFRTLVRNECRGQSQDDLMSNPTVITDMEARIKASMEAHCKEIGLPIVIKDVVIGKVTPNIKVLEEINNTAAQQQRKNTEDQRKLAEDARKMAEESRAKADNAYRMDMGLSPEQFIQNEQIKAFTGAVNVLANSKNGSQVVLIPPGQNMTLKSK